MLTSVAKDTNVSAATKPQKSSFFDQERVVPQISEENVDPTQMTENNVHQILETNSSINQRDSQFKSSSLGKGQKEMIANAH